MKFESFVAGTRRLSSFCPTISFLPIVGVGSFARTAILRWKMRGHSRILRIPGQALSSQLFSGLLRHALIAAVFLLVTAFSVTEIAVAAEIKPAIVYDLGGRNDRSFNEGVYNGAEKFKADTGVEYRDFEIQNDSQREQAIRNFAKKGYNPVVAVGFSHAAAMEKVAPDFPDTSFTIIDMVVDLPNVSSVVFKEHEGSYLVGVLAAMASKTAKVGFVGGMDIPLIRKFACGYVGGVKSVSADAEVFQNMTGTTGAAWSDPVKGGELATSQFDRGADVVYHAAGGTGLGVLQAAADSGNLGIGVDSNQNHLHPGSVLTSMLKRVDVAAYDAFKNAMDDSFQAGVKVMGLKEGGVGWSLDEHNEPLVSADMKAAVEAVAQDIKSGKIVVHDYMSDSNCPY